MKGLLNIIIQDLLMLLLILAIGAVGMVLLGYVDYGYLYKNKDGEFFKAYKWDNHTKNALIGILWAVIGVAAMFFIYKLILDIKNHTFVKKYYSFIEINQEDLETMAWQEVVQRIKENFLAHFQTGLNTRDELHIMNVIMREENYLIGLTNTDIIDLNINFPWFLGGKHLFATDFIYEMLKYTIFNVNYGIDGIDNLRTVKRDDYKRSLHNRFILNGIIILLLMPVIFVVLLFYFVTRYGTQAYSNTGSIAKGKWTPLARWKLRHYNEAENLFTDRLKRGYDSAAAYADLFPLSSHITWAARYLTYIVGFILVIMIIFTATSPRVVFDVFGISSVTVLSVLTIAFGILITLGPKETLKDDFDKKLADVCVYTEYLPKDWKEHPKSPKTNAEFQEYFTPRLFIWLNEVMSIIFAPYIFIAKLPKCAGNIADFMIDQTDESLKVCKYAMFGTTTSTGDDRDDSYNPDNGDDDNDDNDSDNDSDNDEKDDKDDTSDDADADTDGVTVIQMERTEEGGEEERRRQREEVMKRHEEKSLLCFMRDYPEWEKPRNGVRLLRRVKKHVRRMKKSEKKEVITNTIILNVDSEFHDACYDSDDDDTIVNSIYASTILDSCNSKRK